MLEWYRLGFDDQQLMQEVAELVALVLGPDAVQTVTYQQLVGDVSGRGDVQRSELDLRFAEACEKLQPGRFFVWTIPPIKPRWHDCAQIIRVLRRALSW